MRILSKSILVTLALASTLSFQACDLKIVTGDTNTTPSVQPVKNKAPIIAAFDYSPKTGVSKEDFITFTVVASDPEGDTLQYNWTSTKGNLTANSGSVVSWRPLQANGTFESGLSNVTLIVSDQDGKTTTASANIMIDKEGKATIEKTEIIKTDDVSTGSSDITPSVMPTIKPSVIPTVTPTVKPSTTIKEVEVFNNGNIAAVYNGPTSPTTFTLTKAYVITKMMTYHWNNAVGSTITGTHSFESSSGKVYGPYKTTGSLGQGGVPNAYWNSTPNVTLPAGTYTIIDSDESTWAQNTGSGGKGQAIIYGYPSTSSSVSTDPVIEPSDTPTDYSNATGELKSGGSTLPYYQLDFTTRYNNETQIAVGKVDGVPISGYKDAATNRAMLSFGQAPDGKAYPPKFYWDVPSFKTKFLLMTNFLAWWGEKYAGEKFATLTVEDTSGHKQIFDLVVGTHVAEWNGGAITENPPAVRVIGGSVSRVFVDRFELDQVTDIKRITVDLQKCPMWSNTEYAAWFIDGITLVGEWQI
jgi:hypothetical protein